MRGKKGQFTIAGLFALFIMLIVTIQLFPTIYDLCNQGAQMAQDKGDILTAYLIRLIPPSIVISELMAIYYYAKPLIFRGE